MILKCTVAWMPMVLIAIVNPVIREEGYTRYLGELRAHQLSTLAVIILFGFYIWALSRWWPIQSSRQAIAIGLIWLGLTVAFEFLFGHYVMGNPWTRLLHDYNLEGGSYRESFQRQGCDRDWRSFWDWAGAVRRTGAEGSAGCRG